MTSSTVVEITVAGRVPEIARAAFLEMFFFLNGSPAHTDWILAVFVSEKQGY